MTDRRLNTIVIVLAVVNIIALVAIAARYQPLLRTFVAPGDVPPEVAETEQELEQLRQSGQDTEGEVTLRECKKLLSDCRNYCQNRSEDESLSTAASTTCYTQCEQSFRFCQNAPQ